MKWFMSFALAAALAGGMYAEDKDKTKVKVEGTDPVTGQKVKHKSKTKVDDDGDFKAKSRTKVNGDTVEKTRIKGEHDGDYVEKHKVEGANGTVKTKTKVDK
jgi:hypothetical protein